MKKRSILRLITLIVVVVMIVLCSFSASAYSLLGHRIDSAKVIVPYYSFDTLTIQNMGYAVDKWNALAGNTILIMSTGTHSSSGYVNNATNDGKNYVYKENAGSGYAGQCRYWSTSGRVTQFDININTYYDWANSAQPDRYDVYSVFLHETGHASGLGDVYTSYDTAVMYYNANRNATNRIPKTDDIQGINAIYG